MKLLNRKQTVDLDQISKYISDLDEITELRDKCNNEDELARYDVIIECMQRYLMRLVEVK